MHRLDAIEAAKSSVAFLKGRGILVGSDRDAAIAIDAEPLGGDALGTADLMISFGGDGTLIRAAHLCAAHRTPVLGVYFGRFGFVTQCQPNELGAALSLFIDGQAQIQERMMLQTDLIRNGQTVATLHSLNEACLQRAATTRMLNFQVHVDGQYLNSYPADGVLVATPTGSTGYNLSAGGPIVEPNIPCMILSAITAHTLGTRPLVLPPESEVMLSIETRGDAILSCDGQSRLQLLSGDSVRVTKSPCITRLVTLDQQDFLSKVSDLFFWRRGDSTGDPD